VERRGVEAGDSSVCSWDCVRDSLLAALEFLGVLLRIEAVLLGQKFPFRLAGGDSVAVNLFVSVEDLGDSSMSSSSAAVKSCNGVEGLGGSVTCRGKDLNGSLASDETCREKTLGDSSMSASCVGQSSIGKLEIGNGKGNGNCKIGPSVSGDIAAAAIHMFIGVEIVDDSSMLGVWAGMAGSGNTGKGITGDTAACAINMFIAAEPSASPPACAMSMFRRYRA